MLKSKIQAKDKLILALDVDNIEEARSLIKELKEYIGVFKIGLQLFTSIGPDIINMAHDEGVKIFFDGKFNDIPNTVAQASSNLIKMGVSFFNIHISGGSKMITATVKLAHDTAKRRNLPAPIILGVTVLSSINQDILTEELGITDEIDDYVVYLAKMAHENGLSGVVASVREAEKIRHACGKDFVILCPGIRPSWAEINDQQRIATPADAIKAGADYMVIGRPILAASNRIDAAKMIIDEIQEAL